MLTPPPSRSSGNGRRTGSPVPQQPGQEENYRKGRPDGYDTSEVLDDPWVIIKMKTPLFRLHLARVRAKR